MIKREKSDLEGFLFGALELTLEVTSSVLREEDRRRREAEAFGTAKLRRREELRRELRDLDEPHTEVVIINTNISRKQALRDELLILKLRQAELSMFDDEYASNRRKIRVLENEIYSCR